jgi:dipeptidyl-peptidase-3
MEAVGDGTKCAELLPVIYDPNSLLQRRSTSTEGDIVVLSAGNFYEGVTRAEVEKYYESIEDKTDETPIAYGLNTKVTKDANGNIVEIPWKIDGMYGPAIKKICEELKLAAACAENDIQKRALALLIKYYETGDLKIWDEFNIEWVKDTIGTVDFINGFIEDYNDPLGRKGAWEGYVNIKDHKASERSTILSANAQWFEDHSPVDPRFKKKECKGISAKVINAVCLAGDSYPSTPIGINLPNADWIRKQYGSKSVTIANITHAYDYAAQESPTSTLDEFAWDEAEKAFYREWGSWAVEIHTDLHECLGHGSGQLLPGVSTTAIG